MAPDGIALLPLYIQPHTIPSTAPACPWLILDILFWPYTTTAILFAVLQHVPLFTAKQLLLDAEHDMTPSYQPPIWVFVVGWVGDECLFCWCNLFGVL